MAALLTCLPPLYFSWFYEMWLGATDPRTRDTFVSDLE